MEYGRRLSSLRPEQPHEPAWHAHALRGFVPQNGGHGTRVTRADVGRWLALKPLGAGSAASSRRSWLFQKSAPAAPGASIPARFAADVMKPVRRDERVHIDHLPPRW